MASERGSPPSRRSCDSHQKLDRLARLTNPDFEIALDGYPGWVAQLAVLNRRLAELSSARGQRYPFELEGEHKLGVWITTELSKIVSFG